MSGVQRIGSLGAKITVRIGHSRLKATVSVDYVHGEADPQRRLRVGVPKRHKRSVGSLLYQYKAGAIRSV